MTDSKPTKILLLQLGDIGDVVLSFPCIRAVKETYPQAKIFVAVRDKAEPLIEMCRWADGVIPVCKKKQGFWHEFLHQFTFITHLRRHKFDLAIDLRTSQRGAILAYLSGAGKRVSFYEEGGSWWRNRLFTELFKAVHVPHKHVIDYYLDFLASLGIVTQNRQPELTVSKEKQKQFTHLLDRESIPVSKPFVVIQPFSLWKYKEWGAEKFIELIRWLVENYDVSIVLAGGPSERDQSKAILDKFSHGVYNLVGKTTLDMYAALLHASEILISVDSSGPHIAAAVGTKTITIYGPASPLTWAPRGCNHVVVQKDLPCVPCCRAGCEGSTTVSRCLDQLDVDDVRKAVMTQLDRELS